MLQVLFNGLVTGFIIALPAVAVTLLFGVLRFANFAAGAVMTISAYIVYALNVHMHLPLLISAAVGAAVCAGLMIVCDELVFRRLRDRGAITLMVASLGLSFVLENIPRLIFGNSARSFDFEISPPFRLLGIRANAEQAIAVAATLALMSATYFVLHHLPIGRAMRAVADNPSLSLVRGIDRGVVTRFTWAISGVLLAVAGVLIGLDRALEPIMGSGYLITVFAAAIVGGLGSPVGAVLGALVVGAAGELSTLVLPTSYRLGVPLCLIAAILVFRPQGLLGRRSIKK